LEHTDLANRYNEFLKLLGTELGPRLNSIRNNVVGGEVGKSRSGHSDEPSALRSRAGEEDVHGPLCVITL
jgi:hypothetical protein